MPRRYPPEFRRKSSTLLKSGLTVAAGLDVTEQTVHNWCGQELIDTGQKPTVNSIENAELTAALRCYRRVGDRTRHHLTLHGTAEVGGAPKRRFEAIEVMAKEEATRSYGMSLSGGVGVRLLRVAQSPTLGTLATSSLGDAADR